ncbi:MAG: diguanylate cyclase [Gemmataceae bacterium]
MQHPLCQQMRIDQDEILARRAFLNFTADDEQHLRLIHEAIADDVDGIIAEFYAHLFQFPQLDRFLNEPAVRQRLQQLQRRYLLELGQHSAGLDYFESRLRTGVVHERVGLEQKWYLGGYAVLFERISQRLARVHGQDAALLAGLQVTLQKMLALDATLAVETYYQATMQRLESLLDQLTEAQKSLQELARVDELTRVSNRRHVMESLHMEVERSLRFRHPFSLLFLDLDHFKEVNDRHGHGAGDQVLSNVVATVRSVLRPADVIGRYGGEEFLVGLVETDGRTALRIAERIRRRVAQTPFYLDHGEVRLTISIGLTSLQGDSDIETLLKQADQALYHAKETGRNRVCTAPAS